MLCEILRGTAVAGFAAASLGAALPSAAQVWPEKFVKLVVPFPTGGSVDPLARLLGTRLGQSFGQQFVIENKPGASGSVGTAYVAKSAPDGYTFVLAFDTHAVNPALFPNMGFDTVKDLAPVMLVGTAPMMIGTHPAKPYMNFRDVIAAAKAKPGTISAGNTSHGSAGHLALLSVQQAAGAAFLHVPYKGGGPMLQDAMGGQIDVGISSVASFGPLVKSGRLRALAVTSDQRSHVLPDVPTLGEQGFPLNAFAWWAIFAPAGVPKPILEKFHAELIRTLSLPDIRATLGETLGMTIVAASPEATQKFVIEEIARWGKVVRDNNLRAE